MFKCASCMLPVSYSHTYNTFTTLRTILGSQTQIWINLLLIYRPQKDERLSWPSWLTCSGRLTHISGYPSATDRAWDRKSSTVKDRRSTGCQSTRHMTNSSHGQVVTLD